MDWQSAGIYILIYIACYLLGSIPSAYLIGRIYRIDIRAQGSGNVGAMNTKDVLGWRPALLVLLMDLGKGVAAVYLAQTVGVNPTLAAAIVVGGHIFPVWLGFRGGKGLAVGAGALLAAGYPLTVLIFLIVFFIVYPLIKQVDWANIIGVAAAFIISFIWIWHGWDVYLIILGLIICMKHAWALKENPVNRL